MYSRSKGGRPLYSSRLVDLVLQLVNTEYPQIDTAQLLAEAGIEAYEVADPGRWFPREQVDLFVEGLIERTGNQKIFRDVGRFAASAQAMGSMRQRILWLVSPAKAFTLIHKAIRNFTRSVDYRLQTHGDDAIEVIVTPAAGRSEKIHHCEHRTGFLESIVKVFNIQDPELSHPECIHKGGDCCRYLISWQHHPSAPWVRARGYAVPALLIVNLTGFTVSPGLTLNWLAPASVLLLFGFGLWVDRLEKKELADGVKNLQDSTENLAEELNIHYNNSQLAAEIGQVISNKTDVDGILAALNRLLQERLDFDRGAIFMVNDNRTRLELKTVFGSAEPLRRSMADVSFYLNGIEAQGAFVQAFHERKPMLVHDVSELKERLSACGLELVRKSGTRSFVSCPITCEGEAIGVLAVDNAQTERPLTKSDVALLMGLVPIIGLSLHNARLLEQRSKQFNSILQVLSASIDARDFLTAGHSEKVTRYSVGICRELCLSTEETDVIRVAAMLHDYGKIGVPDFILRKEGRLTEDERALVETHPGKTREILASVNFEGRYREIPNIAGAHHEKIDGSGYPHGLKEEEIPLGAKIIAVADFFEAITAKRHYRGPMSVETALTLLRDGSGSHFDPAIVGALINYVTRSREFNLAEKDGRARFFHRHVRIPCRCQVSCKVEKRTIAGSSANLSLGGLFIATGDRVESNSLIDVVFTLPKFPDRLIKARGRIAWVNSKRKVPQLPAGFGVQFIALPEEDSTEIKEFVSQVFAAA